MIYFFFTIYLIALFGMSCYGFLGFATLFYHSQYGDTDYPCPPFDPATLPPVTVQLALYNEQFVVKRLLNAILKLNYPVEKLQIQILDDSTDATTQIARNLIQDAQKQGFNIELHHRTNRIGYKAGALAAGMKSATGDFILFFDADFVPPPNFLYETIPHFLTNPQLGVLQARWTHLNRSESILTAAQAVAIDKHFILDQAVRHYANLVPKFNGSAGLWRRTAIDDAGGWEGDTVTEDLCLSIRAALKGWEFRFLKNVTAPAEIPATLTAFKTQQARWAKGSMQCLQKFGYDLLTTSRYPLSARLYALFTMAGYLTQLFMIIALLSFVPLLFLRFQFSPLLLIFTVAGIAQPALFFLGQKLLYPNWLQRLHYFPPLILIGAGLAASNSRAIIQSWLKLDHPFYRTPKKGSQTAAQYHIPFDPIILIELALTLYAFSGLLLALYTTQFGALLFPLFTTLSFGYVTFTSFMELSSKRTQDATEQIYEQ